ncbi:MAG: hypothetical protein JST38_03885 [Bacteroidetes bacterium]|nr:hypothetical protein [Pseudomonadota bacterium]MBS1939999.1 hypothetical protein [Bacteroidota bacterium]
MNVDWLTYGLFVFGTAKLLNATAFKQRPTSGFLALSLTVLIFIGSVAALPTLKLMRHQAISDSVGASITSLNPLDMGAAFIFAWLFLSFFNHQEKSQQPPTDKE